MTGQETARQVKRRDVRQTEGDYNVIRKILIISILIFLLKNSALASEREPTAEDSIKINDLFEKNNITYKKQLTL